MTVIPLPYWLIAAAIMWALSPILAKAEPVAAADAGGVRIVVYTEDCTFTGTVTNLPKRATWTENGKTLEGCVGAFPEIGIALFYFSDKTVVPVPMQMFQRVIGS